MARTQQQPSKVKIRVPQEGDEISISRNGDIDNPTVYAVTNGTVEVEEADVEHFLSVIDGSTIAEGSRSEPTPDPT